jgi:integrase-like protein
VPNSPNQRWSLDFASDTLADGRRFRILCVVDDFSRECLALVADTSLSGKRVARELDTIGARRGLPLTVVSDNGTELTGTAVLRWSQDRTVGWTTSHPASRSRTRSRKASSAACATSASTRRCSPRCGTPGPCWRVGSAIQRGSAALGVERAHARLAQAAAVLAWLNPAARRLRRWPAARVDPDCARRRREPWPGRGNGARPNRKHRHDRHDGNRGLYF